jgi:ATP-dependent RNA helicase SUPV3L1/SUV3
MAQQWSRGQPIARVQAILGPTNTGKTHYAIERMLAYKSGLIGLPLRLLAREVYNRVVQIAGRNAVALITGEERIVPKGARYWVATVEAMPAELSVEFVAVDEIQTATHFERGHVFTDRILGARGRYETLLLGAETMAPIIRSLLPNAEITSRPRLSQLSYAGSKKITRLPPRSAIVAFTAGEVYAIAELIRRHRGGAAVVMGALSPRTRNAQVELYENRDVDFLVATDAIGMGLNLDITHVALAADQKFDGKQWRHLNPAEFAQIVGRAGRHKRNGTFGVTGGVAEFEPELALALEDHEFEPVRVLQWRSGALDFSALSALAASLEMAPTVGGLTRIPATNDQVALAYLMGHEIARKVSGCQAVELAWQVCQIPDYCDVSPARHGELVTSIFSDLNQRGTINTDWIAEQVSFCDNTNGEIDTLSNRIRQTRTWTYVANRKNWLDDPGHWRERTREIEDRLSDALHEKLTQRFVDRRTSVLLRHLRDRKMTTPEISKSGEVTIEGQVIGSIEGFRFTLQKTDGEADGRELRQAARAAIAPEIAKRAARATDAPNGEFVLTSDGLLRWGGEVVAELVAGDDVLAPRLVVLADESLSGPELEQVQDRLLLWLRHAINTLLEPLMGLREPTEIDGTARGVCFRLTEALGVLPRQAVAADVKSLDQDVRGKMRKLGVKFGAYHIYVPATLKPAPRELALILWALKNGGVRQPGVAELPTIALAGRTTVSVDPEFNPTLYEVAGFKVTGQRAVRVDILERLADIIRPLIAFNPKVAGDRPAPEGAAEGNGFRATVEMTSLLGCAGEEFASVLEALGYRMARREIVGEPATPSAPTEAAEAVSAEAVPATEVTSGIEAASATDETIEAAPGAEVTAKASIVSPTEEAATPTVTPSETPAEPEATAEETPAEPEATAEETLAPQVETASIKTASIEAENKPGTGGTGPSTPPIEDAPAEAAPAPAEPRFDEIWAPAPRRHTGPRRHAGPRGEKRSGGQNAKSGDRAEAGDGQKVGQAKNRHRPKGKKGQPDRQRGDKNEGPRPNRRDRQVRQERPMDPDSPFAALAALRETLPRQK